MKLTDLLSSKSNDIAEWRIVRIIKNIFKENLIILSLSGAYIGGIQIILFFKVNPTLKYSDYRAIDKFTFILLSILLAGQIIKRLNYLKKGFIKGLLQIYDEMRQCYINVSKMGGALVIYLALPFFIRNFSEYKQLFPSIEPFFLDRAFMKIDFILHFGHHPWMLLQPLLGYPSITVAIDLLYMFWFPVMFSFILGMAWSTHR